MAPKSKLTDEVQDRIATLVSAGVPVKHAASHVGIGQRTVMEWLEKGRAEKARQPYRGFAERIDQAKGTLCVGLVNEMVKKARAGEVRAIQWMLERRFPDDFAQRHELTGPNGSPLQNETVNEGPVTVQFTEQIRRNVFGITDEERAEFEGGKVACDMPSGEQAGE